MSATAKSHIGGSVELAMQQMESLRKIYKSPADQDSKSRSLIDHDLNKTRDHDQRSIMISDPPVQKPLSNPDGLDEYIRGRFADILKNDPLYLQARAWKVHPAILTTATKNKGADFVRQEIQFVFGLKDSEIRRSRGAYLKFLLSA